MSLDICAANIGENIITIYMNDSYGYSNMTVIAFNVINDTIAPQYEVIFPEGEVYHCNDRITPFREGAAAIAMFSARKAKRPIVAIPAALKYRYVEDPTGDLLKLMDTLEESIHWRPR